MPTKMDTSNATAEPKRKMSSTAAKLMQAAALAAVLVPLGSVATEADPINCGFSGSSSDANNGGVGCSFSFGDRNRYNWDEYYLDLTFQDLDPEASFDITITDVPMDSETAAARASGLGDYTCVPLTDGGPCIDFFFEFIPEYPDPRQWTSYTFEIHWDKFEGQPVFDPSTLRVLHDIGGTPTNAYDEDMCLTQDPCTIDPDPGIRSGDTDFRSLSVYEAASPIPEPSTLILLGTGVSGVLYRGRRRRQQSEAEPTA